MSLHDRSVAIIIRTGYKIISPDFVCMGYTALVHITAIHRISNYSKSAIRDDTDKYTDKSHNENHYTECENINSSMTQYGHYIVKKE